MGLEWKAALEWNDSSNQAVFESLKEKMAEKLEADAKYVTEDGDADRSWEIINGRIRNMFENKARQSRKSAEQKHKAADQASMNERTIQVSSSFNSGRYIHKI